MKKKLATACALTIMAASAPMVQAKDFGLGVKLSTLGAGLEVEQRLGDNLGLRLGVNYLPISTHFTVDDVRYKAEFSWSSVALLADYYPFSGIFRLSGGVIYNGNKVDVTGTPQGDVNIGDHTYPAAAAGTISGSVDFNKIAPYAGVGWSGGGTQSGSWSVNLDLGVMFQGSPSVNNLSASGVLGSNPAFSADLEKEKADIEDEMDSYRYYPVVAFGIAYHF